MCINTKIEVKKCSFKNDFIRLSSMTESLFGLFWVFVVVEVQLQGGFGVASVFLDICIAICIKTLGLIYASIDWLFNSNYILSLIHFSEIDLFWLIFDLLTIRSCQCYIKALHNSLPIFQTAYKSDKRWKEIKKKILNWSPESTLFFEDRANSSVV